MSQLRGHGLQREGAAHLSNGELVGIFRVGTSGIGRGKCSCGELSPFLNSGGKRKQWHREHKDSIRSEGTP